MRILGLSCDFHDAAAALIVDGSIVAAAEEERFTRLKHDSNLPIHAITSCLAIGGITPDDLDVAVFHEKPLVTANRALAAKQSRGPAGVRGFIRDFPVLVRRNLMIADRLDQALRTIGGTRTIPLRYSEHHLSHAAAAFYPSPFETAAIVTVDGLGEWATATIGHGSHHRIDLLAEQVFPNSLGLLYSLITQWCGFEPNDGEYKLMGLAPYGSPQFLDALGELATIADDGSIKVNTKRVKGFSVPPRRMRALAARLGGLPSDRGAEPSQRDADLAASMQSFVETALMRTARHVHELTGERNLCLAGGVALNGVAAGSLLRDGPFDGVWIQPAAGDAGSAVGAALWWWHDELGHSRRELAPAVDDLPEDGMAGSFLGPEFSSAEITDYLDRSGVDYRIVSSASDRVEEIARRLAAGEIVGWFCGRMEFGPRALGHRSILADPRSAEIRRDLNIRVKGRESFRPFAPAVLWERADEWFQMDHPSPYMGFVHRVAESALIAVDEPTSMAERVGLERSTIAACTHVDGSARVQTVHRSTNPGFHALLSAFEEITGIPVVLNTSFNVGGEPIVCTPADALRTARVASLDVLVLEDCVVEQAAIRSTTDRSESG